MKSVFVGVSMLMLGTVLAVGCGGGVQEPPDTRGSQDSQPAVPSDSCTPDSALPSWQPLDKVKASGACCYVKCSMWHGPFPDVDYNNCTNFGRYWCPQQGGGAFSDAKWDNC